MTFREMLIEDLDQVMEIETDLFAMPWTKEGMFTFLTREDTMFFVVEEKGRILGYCSMQTVLDEGDILNVAVRSDRQKEGIGYFLVDSMLMLAQAQGISMVHLEVRESNGTARRLYQFTFLTREDTMFFVVEEKGRILGYCSMQTVLDEGDILNVAVRSDRQKEGIGYFLVDSMLMLAQAQGISMVHLEVRESNGTARRLYQRLGFVEDGLRKNYYTDPLENAVLMTKKQ